MKYKQAYLELKEELRTIEAKNKLKIRKLDNIIVGLAVSAILGWFLVTIK